MGRRRNKPNQEILSAQRFPLRLLVCLLAALPGLVIPQATAQPAARAATANEPPRTASHLSIVTDIAGRPDAASRREAARRLLSESPPGTPRAVADLLQSRNNEPVKLALCEAIAELRLKEPQFMQPLLALLDGTDAVLRKAAASALAAYRDPEVVARLRDYNQKQEIAFLLDSHSALMKAFYERTPEADRPALLLLWLKQPLAAVERLTALDIVHQGLRKGTTPDPAVLDQIRLMLNDPEDVIRQKAVLVLRDRGLREDAARIQRMLDQDQSTAVREAIYSALGLLGDPASTSTVIRGLDDPAETVAAEAATALGRLGEPRPGPSSETAAAAVQALADRASRPIPDAKLRERIVDAMAQIADPRFLPALTRYAAPDEPVAAVRQAAVSGLGHAADRTKLPLVIERLVSDPDAGVRAAAAEAIGRLGGDSQHLRVLRERLDPAAEPSTTVQNRAWEAYQAIFTNLPAPEQKNVLQTWNTQEPGAPERRIDLLTALEKKVSSSKSDPVQLTAIREQLGDALVAASRPADASAVLARAMETVNPDPDRNRNRLALKLADANLQAGAPEKARILAVSLPAGQVRTTILEKLLKHVEALVKSDPPAARTFLDRLSENAAGQLGAAWEDRFNAQRRRLPPATAPGSVPAPA